MSELWTLGLDGRNTEISFAVPWLGVATVRGTFSDVRGILSLPNGDVESATLHIDVGAASVGTGLSLRDHHLRSHQFLDVGRHPRIRFESEYVARDGGALRITGTLTLCGVERELVARCPLGWASGEGVGSTVVLATSLEIPRLDHGIGAAHGIHRLNPLLRAIGPTVDVRVRLLVPATRLLPALLPALGR